VADVPTPEEKVESPTAAEGNETVLAPSTSDAPTSKTEEQSENPPTDEQLDDSELPVETTPNRTPEHGSAPHDAQSPAHPGGRKPVVNWGMVGREVFRLMELHDEFSVDDPDWNAQARLEEAVENYCRTTFQNVPSESTIRDNIRKPLAQWRLWRKSRSET
jgi:hypothetical protein